MEQSLNLHQNYNPPGLLNSESRSESIRSRSRSSSRIGQSHANSINMKDQLTEVPISSDVSEQIRIDTNRNKKSDSLNSTKIGRVRKTKVKINKKQHKKEFTLLETQSGSDTEFIEAEEEVQSLIKSKAEIHVCSEIKCNLSAKEDILTVNEVIPTDLNVLSGNDKGEASSFGILKSSNAPLPLNTDTLKISEIEDQKLTTTSIKGTFSNSKAVSTGFVNVACEDSLYDQQRSFGDVLKLRKMNFEQNASNMVKKSLICCVY